MAVYFVDSTTGDDGDDGTTMDLAWATLAYALASGGLAAGDTVFVRRLHSETPGAIIAPAYAGTVKDNINVVGWPRAADASITSATWTNGSTTVDLIVGLSMDREQHLGRFITGPDGYDYLITKITDSNTIIIDREYAGSTVSGASGACTIKADEDWVDDMGTAYGFDDSAWTIKESTWDADADDLPLIDFSGDVYYIYLSSDNAFNFRNIDFSGGTSTYGFLRVVGSDPVGFIGCLFQQTNNTNCMSVNQVLLLLNRCIIVGSVGAAQTNISIANSTLFLRNVASYSAGDYNLELNGVYCYFENVNLGVEGASGDDEIVIAYPSWIHGRDVKMDGTSGLVLFSSCYSGFVSIENYGKALAAHKKFVSQGSITKTDVVAGSGDPYKRTGGADSVVEIQFDASTYQSPDQNFVLFPILEHEFEATTDTRTYRYYVQAEGAVTAAELWIEVEYVASHDDTSEYVIKKVVSDEAITARDDASDWDQYIEVTGIAPAVASKVRIKCYCRYYSATNKIYIDPAVEIS